MVSDKYLGDRAAVIGAGIGGLLAAGALRDFFREVVVLERDNLPDQPADRKGVPQGPHGHAVLKRGENVAESLFPGFQAALKEAGGVIVDSDVDVARYESGDWAPSAGTGLKISSQSRALLEHVLRERVRDCDNIVIREGVRCSDFILSDGRVQGVQVDCGGLQDEKLNADIVVDASGRAASTHLWLERNGFGKVPVERLGINLVYVTGIFSTESFVDDMPILCALREDPPNTRGGSTMPIEGNRWMVTLSGRHDDVPPLDMDGFFDFAKALPHSLVYDRLRASKLEGRLRRFVIPESFWRHYEQMEKFPSGLIPIGDAIAGFNPVFGQGMSAAAVGAEQLQIALATKLEAGEGLEDLHESYLPSIAEAIGYAWSGTATLDLMYDSTEGERPDDFPQRRAAFLAMQELAREDLEIRRLQTLVGNMLEPPSVLARPDIAARLQERMGATEKA